MNDEYAIYRRALSSGATTHRWTMRLFAVVAGTVAIAVMLMYAAAGAWLSALAVGTLAVIGALFARWWGTHSITLDKYGQPATADDADRLDRLRVRDPKLAQSAQRACPRFDGR